MVENFRPDVKDRLGINYSKLEKINPKIILASISGLVKMDLMGKDLDLIKLHKGWGLNEYNRSPW